MSVVWSEYTGRVNVSAPRPNAETVGALLDTTWRTAAAEGQRTDALDRKAATVATFASVVAALTAALGVQFVERLPNWWALALFVAGLAVFVAAVTTAVLVLYPREHLTLGMAYLRRFPTWGEILKPPEQVRGETMRTLVESIARERSTNEKKARWIRRSFVLLLIGLGFVALEGVTLGVDEVLK